MWSSRLRQCCGGPPKLRAKAGPAAVLVIWLGAGAVLSACPICFQVDDAGVTAGVRAAVVVLGGVTSGVLVGVAMFARRLVNAERAERAERTERTKGTERTEREC
jgi:hypothetical protein